MRLRARALRIRSSGTEHEIVRARLSIMDVCGGDGERRCVAKKHTFQDAAVEVCQPAWRWLGAVASRNTFSWPAVHGPILSTGAGSVLARLGDPRPTARWLLSSSVPQQEKIRIFPFLLELFQKWMIHDR